MHHAFTSLAGNPKACGGADSDYLWTDSGDCMNDNRPLPTPQAAHPETSGQPMDTGTGQAGSGSPSGSRALSTRASEALADKEARRICIRQLSTAELDHEETVIAKQLAILHGTLADIRRERKYRRSLRG